MGNLNARSLTPRSATLRTKNLAPSLWNRSAPGFPYLIAKLFGKNNVLTSPCATKLSKRLVIPFKRRSASLTLKSNVTLLPLRSAVSPRSLITDGRGVLPKFTPSLLRNSLRRDLSLHPWLLWHPSFGYPCLCPPFP